MSIARTAVLCAMVGVLPHAVLARADVAASKLIIFQGRALAPLRHVSEWLGAQVSFDATTKVVGVRLRQQDVQFRLGSSEAKVNGTPVKLDTPAVERSGTIYVPLRFLAEAMHTASTWDPSNGTVTIRHPFRNAVLRLSATGSAESLLAPAAAPTALTAPAPPPAAPASDTAALGYEVLTIAADLPQELVDVANRQGCPLSALSALFGVDFSNPHGCIIGTLTPGGLAEKIGLMVGDSIVQCNGGEITCPRTFVPLLSTPKEPGKVELTVHRPK